MQRAKSTFVLTAIVTLLLGGLGASAGQAAPSHAAGHAAHGDVSTLAVCPYSGGHPTTQRGNDGDYVRHAQCLLRNVWGYVIAVDGDFGPATENAVKDFQDRCGVDVDGIVGPDTWDALHPDTYPCRK